MGAILIVNGKEQQASGCFDAVIRAHLPPGSEVEVVRDSKQALEALSRKSYAVAIVEHILPEPLEMRPDGVWVRADEIMQVIGQRGTVGFHPNGTEFYQSAHHCLEAFGRAAPTTRFVIVSHAKGGGAGRERAAYEAHPQVVGLFGRLDSKATLSRIVPSLRKILEGAVS